MMMLWFTINLVLFFEKKNGYRSQLHIMVHIKLCVCIYVSICISIVGRFNGSTKTTC